MIWSLKKGSANKVVSHFHQNKQGEFKLKIFALQFFDEDGKMKRDGGELSAWQIIYKIRIIGNPYIY